MDHHCLVLVIVNLNSMNPAFETFFGGAAGPGKSTALCAML